MNTDFSILLKELYALEGLVALAEKRGDNVPPLMLDAIAQQWSKVNQLFENRPEPQPEPEISEVSEPSEVSEISQPSEHSEISEVSEHSEQSEFSEISQPSEPSEPTEIPQPFELAQPTQLSEPTLRLDSALQRNIAKDLRKAFSINDKFRFRRELFGNSDIEMADAIDLVDAMKSYDEAEDYFFGDLEWDPENPDVADFMAIIKNHFN